MTDNGPPEADDAQAKDIVRTRLRTICAATGLQEPDVRIITRTGSKKQEINGRFKVRRGTPTVEVTCRAALELLTDGLTFLIGHELGHFHGHHAWRIIHRWTSAGIALGLLIFLIGVAGLIVTSYFGEPTIVPSAWTGAGMVLTLAAIALYCALSRREETRADLFAVTYQQTLIGAEQFFTARAADRVEKEPSTRFWRKINLLLLDHPYRSMRLASMRSQLENGRTPSRRPR
jgi:Zn-dependent protease with chaperone function